MTTVSKVTLRGAIWVFATSVPAPMVLGPLRAKLSSPISKLPWSTTNAVAAIVKAEVLKRLGVVKVMVLIQLVAGRLDPMTEM